MYICISFHLKKIEDFSCFCYTHISIHTHPSVNSTTLVSSGQYNILCLLRNSVEFISNRKIFLLRFPFSHHSTYLYIGTYICEYCIYINIQRPSRCFTEIDTYRLNRTRPKNLSKQNIFDERHRHREFFSPRYFPEYIYTHTLSLSLTH